MDKLKKLKKLFSPSTLAATISTGMLLHATIALASTSCLSQCVSGTMPINCTHVCGQGGSTGYWCCQDEPCGMEFIDTNCTVIGPQFVGWCICP